jgi:hypothetical protein
MASLERAAIKPGKKPTFAGAKTQTVPVTVDNFIRAESDMYFASAIRQANGIGRFEHRREIVPIDRQTTARPNRDTLYSTAVFDLDAGPVSISLPHAGRRFMSLMVIDEDHYVRAVLYNAGKYTFSRQQMGTRYVLVGIRTLVDPDDPNDVEEVNSLQDAIKVEQRSSGTFEVPSWDPVSQKRVRDALLVLALTMPDSKQMFGSKNEVDPIRHLIGTAMGWGGNPEKDATYFNVTPARNDGSTIHHLRVKHVPVDGFWSISVYNPSGHFEPNRLNAYTLNSVTAHKEVDGSINVQFGGCDGSTPNCLPIVRGWNYLVRLYRPREEILNGTWKFPEAQPVG